MCFVLPSRVAKGTANCSLSKNDLGLPNLKKRKKRKRIKFRKLLLGSDSYLNPVSLHSYRRLSFKMGHRNSFFLSFFFFGANF